MVSIKVAHSLSTSLYDLALCDVVDRHNSFIYTKTFSRRLHAVHQLEKKTGQNDIVG